jgi:hypothetical protein
VKLPRIWSEAFQRGLVRTGTAVWLLAGIALLAATVPGDADVPQLLVLRRTVQTGQVLRLGEDRVVKRLRNTTAIEEWVSAGAKL